MTPAQLTTLKADVLADPTLAAMSSGPGTDYGAIAAAYNAAASPAFYVWRSTVTADQWRNAITLGATQLDGLTAGKRDSLLWICQGTLDCRNSTIRAALDDLTGSQATLKAAIVAAEKRTVTRAEKLFADTSGGNGLVATPAVATFEGSISINDVADAFR